MTEAINGFLRWLNSSEAALGVIIAVLGGIGSMWFSWHQRKVSRRQRAADLFDRFYSAGNYHAIVGPVFISRSWAATNPCAKNKPS